MAKSNIHYRFLDHEVDYTFRFFANGSVIIVNNDTNALISPKELSGSSLRFFAGKQIQFIKQRLEAANRDAG